MSWTTPEFTEIKMDAEVGSYQPDEFDGPGQDPIASPEPPVTERE
jgi:hypothetical protein